MSSNDNGATWKPKDPEIEAMHEVARVLDALDPAARVRVLWYSLSRFCPHVPPGWVDKVLTWGLPDEDYKR